MTRLLLSSIILHFLTPFSLFSQFSAYYPNGEKVKIEFKTVKELLDSLGVSEVDSYDHTLGYVYFKRLSNIPIFILFLEKENPLRIREMITAYDYKEYINSFSYYWDLKDMISDGKLSKSYLNEVFKYPDFVDLENNNQDRWVYYDYNLTVVFDGEMAIGADVINFKSIKKYGLSITDFKVIGSEYSIGFYMTVLNKSAKTIKYLFVTSTAKNPVDDAIDSKTVKLVGPIKTNDTSSFELSDLYFSRVSEYLTLDNIKIQYMDGSTINLTKDVIKEIRLVDWEELSKRRQ